MILSPSSLQLLSFHKSEQHAFKAIIHTYKVCSYPSSKTPGGHQKFETEAHHDLAPGNCLKSSKKEKEKAKNKHHAINELVLRKRRRGRSRET